MDAVHALLDEIRKKGLAKGRWLGLLNVLIGRKIAKTAGGVVCNGMTWRELAAILKKARWDRDAVREVGLDPDRLPPRDRQQFWYGAIARAGVDSAAATAAGDDFAEVLEGLGYEVGPAPGQPKDE
jgi:hypothetical protein